MTKAEIRSLITNLLPKRDVTGKFHPNVVDAAIENVMNQVFYDIYMKNPRDLDNYTVTYGDAGTAVTVSQNANTLIYYSTIPANYVPLPDKASGVRHIYTVQGTSLKFVPMSKREINLAGGGSYFKQASGRIGYAVRDEIVEYYLMDASTASAGVRMDVLQAFRAYADTEKVLFPLGRENDVVRAVLELLGVQPPVNLEDRNNELTQQANG